MRRLNSWPESALRPFVIGALAVSVGMACWQGEDSRDSTSTTVALTPDVVFADDSLGWIVEIALTPDRLVALDAMLRPAVHVLDRQTLRRLGAYGRRGDGPGEFKDPEQIVTGAAGTPDGVWILDGVHQRLTRLSLADLERGIVENVETLKMDGPNAGSIVRAPDGRWFAGGWITGGRVARYGEDLTYDRTILGFPAAAGKAPGTTLLQAYESWVVTDPEGGRLAAATRLGGLLEIFDYNGEPIAHPAVPEPSNLHGDKGDREAEDP